MAARNYLRNNVTRSSLFNLAQRAINAPRSKQNADFINDSLTSFIGVLDDICIQSIEHLYETFKDSNAYNSDEYLRTNLDELYRIALERDKDVSEMKATFSSQFFCDLRDGGWESFVPLLDETLKDFTVIARCSRAWRVNLTASLLTNFTIVSQTVTSIKQIVDVIEKRGGCKIGGGMEKYLLTDEMKILSDINDKYGKVYPSVLNPSVNMILRKVVEKTSPQTIIKDAATYAFKYAQQDEISRFKQMALTVFNIRWKK